MAAINPPYAIQGRADHPANGLRRALRYASAGFGVRLAGDLLVTATPGDMNVHVAAGEAMIGGTENSADQGVYTIYNDGVVNLAIAAADPTNPRRDLVVAKVQDAAYSGVTNAWSLVVVTGTPNVSPVDPATPANAIALARVSVAALQASIVAGNITDLRSVRGITVPGVVIAGAGLAQFPLTTLTNSLGADVALNVVSTYFNGPSLTSPGTGVWFVSGTVTVTDSSAAAIYAQLWDGTTIISATTQYVVAGGYCSLALSGVITNPAGNVRISVADFTNNTGVMTYNHTGGTKDCTITGVRIG